MKKKGIQKLFLVENDYDNSEKELCLRELGDSVRGYIKTGVRNIQLDELIILQKEFYRRYKERFDTKKIVNTICEDSKSKLLMSEVKFFEEESLKDTSNFLKKASDDIYCILEEAIGDQFINILQDTAYLSHMDMLYELYEREEKLRKEEKEYEKLSVRYKIMSQIAKKLSENRRMELEELQRELGVDEEDVIIVVDRCDKYFNVRDKKDNIQISLSPIGKKYSNYILNSEQKYSKSIMSQLVFKNCINILNSIENSYEKGFMCELSLEELMPEEEDSIRYLYNRLVDKLIDKNKDMYEAPFFIKEKKERVNENNEKNIFRIYEGWDEDIY